MKAKELVDLIEHFIGNFGDGEILCSDPKQTYLFGIKDIAVYGDDTSNPKVKDIFIIQTEK